MAQPFPRRLGAMPPLHEAEEVQDVSRGGDGSDWGLGKVKAQKARRERCRALQLAGRQRLRQEHRQLGRARDGLPHECPAPRDRSGNKSHSAAFPKELPSWFIKLFTQEDDIVLDPFAGSGTICMAAYELGRNYIGIELKDEYYQQALSNIDDLNCTRQSESAMAGEFKLCHRT